ADLMPLVAAIDWRKQRRLWRQPSCVKNLAPWKMRYFKAFRPVSHRRLVSPQARFAAQQKEEPYADTSARSRDVIRRAKHLAYRPLTPASLTGAVFVASTTVASGTLSQRWHAGFARFYDRMFERGVFTALATRDRAPERICVLDFRPYPFFGSRRQHYVCQP